MSKRSAQCDGLFDEITIARLTRTGVILQAHMQMTATFDRVTCEAVLEHIAT